MQRVLLFAILMFPARCFPQSATFQQVLNFDSSSTQADEIVSTGDGGYAFAGVANIGGNAECFLSRYNSSGENEWTKIYYDQQSHLVFSGIDDTEIFCNQYVRFLLTFDDGFVLGGGIDSSVFITYSNGATVGYGFTRMFALHTDVDGNLLWSKKFITNDNTFGEEAISTSDGSLLLAGSVTQPGLVLRDISLWKLKADGDLQWARSYGGSFDEGVAHVIEVSPSQWMVCGTSESFSNNQNIYLLNTDSAGQLNWSNVYGTSGFDYGKGMVKLNDGYYIFGNAGNGNPSYIALLKTDTTGVLQWANTYGSFLFDSPEDLFTAPNGNLIMLADHSAFAYGMLACEVDAEGSFVDARIYGGTGSGNDFISSMIAEQNAYTLAGVTNRFSGNPFFNQAYLIRTHDGLLSDCFSEPINYDPVSLALTTTTAATSVSVLDGMDYQMMVTVLDSSLLADTLCFSVATHIISDSPNSIHVFPNPANDELIIQSTLPVVRVSCFDQVGKMIFSKEEKNISEIHLKIAALPEGIYFIETKTPGEIFYQKIIIVH